MYPEDGERNSIQGTEIYLPGLQIFVCGKTTELWLRKALSRRYEREGDTNKGENIPEKDIRHSGTAFLHTVMVIQAQVQDEGRIIEDILLVPSLSINR